MTRQRKPEETYCNFVNFKYAVDSKTDINQNGVQIIKNLSNLKADYKRRISLAEFLAYHFVFTYLKMYLDHHYLETKSLASFKSVR